MLTQDEIRKYLSYDPDTGEFIHNFIAGLSPAVQRGRSQYVGKVAGCRSGKYIQIELNNANYYAHHLAWCYKTGVWPTLKVDHINGDGHDNRFNNLRLATNAQNAHNKRMRSDNTSGAIGVYKTKSGKWCAKLAINGKQISLGTYHLKEDAMRSRQVAEQEHFGDFARQA